jgi:hypothetical protein
VINILQKLVVFCVKTASYQFKNIITLVPGESHVFPPTMRLASAAKNGGRYFEVGIEEEDDILLTSTGTYKGKEGT